MISIMDGQSSLENIHGGIEKLLECAVCLETFHEPRKLKCEHIFCKQCLERLLVFSIAGDAIMTCPLCNKVTAITSQQTVNDLLGGYYVQCIMDHIKERFVLFYITTVIRLYLFILDA